MSDVLRPRVLRSAEPLPVVDGKCPVCGAPSVRGFGRYCSTKHLTTHLSQQRREAAAERERERIRAIREAITDEEIDALEDEMLARAAQQDAADEAEFDGDDR